MPVIVVGADTELGEVAIGALSTRTGEVRAFVSDAETAARLRTRGVKVATGDLSDGSHVAGAALHAFTAVLIEEAASDERERSFAATPQAVAAAWGSAVAEAGVRRVIWVGSRPPPPALAASVPECAIVDPSAMSDAEVADEISRLDGLGTLG